MNRRVESLGGGVRSSFNETVFIDLEGVHRRTRRVDATGTSVRPLPSTAAFFRFGVRY